MQRIAVQASMATEGQAWAVIAEAIIASCCFASRRESFGLQLIRRSQQATRHHSLCVLRFAPRTWPSPFTAPTERPALRSSFAQELRQPSSQEPPSQG